MAGEVVGRTGEPFRMVVEEGKVMEFARAVKAEMGDHSGPDAVSSPTYLMASAHWAPGEASAWHGIDRDYRRLLHGEQEFVFYGPPPIAGTELRGQQRIDREYTKEGRRGGQLTFTETVTEFHDEEGHLVASVKTTAIETSRPPTSSQEPSA